MATVLDCYVMAIQTSHPLQHSVASPNDPLAHTNQTQRSHETAANAAHTVAATTPNAETKFLPLHVFNHWVMNLMGNNVPRKTSLQERRERSKQAKPEKTRRGGEVLAHDALVPVAGRARTANVSLSLNLQQDNGNDGQHGLLEEALKGKTPSQNQWPNVYKAPGKKASRADPSSGDASQALQPQGEGEAGEAAYDPAKLREAFRELFPTWKELRQAMQNPERLHEAVDATPEKLEKLKTISTRELRNGAVKMHTAIGGVVSQLTALDILKFCIRAVGPKACSEAMAESRRIFKSVY